MKLQMLVDRRLPSFVTVAVVLVVTQLKKVKAEQFQEEQPIENINQTLLIGICCLSLQKKTIRRYKIRRINIHLFVTYSAC